MNLTTLQNVLNTSPKRVGIVAGNHANYVEAIFACMKAGIVAVPLKDAQDHYRIQTAGVEAVIEPEVGNSWLTAPFQPRDSDELALISFTSGTEGPPKGVMLTHNNLANVISRLNTFMQIDGNISEYIGVPVYYSFGLGRCRAVASVGGRFFMPATGFNPSEIANLLKRGEINAISAVPSLWRILLENKHLLGKESQRVRWIEIGSQYMSRSEKEALKTLFPNAIIVQHYGLTEASRTTLLAIHQVEGQLLESVGQVTDTVEIKLTSEGHIAIRGPHVATGYLMEGRPIRLQDDNQGWFTTNDLGHLDDNAYLYYQGRADDIINCGGIKVSPEALETKVYQDLQRSQGIAICRKQDALRGDGFLVAVTKEAAIDKQQLHDRVLQATQAFGVNAANAITIVEVDDLPKTSSGKIQRRQLAQWYASMVPDEPKESKHATVIGGTSIQQIFYRILKVPRLQPQDTFITLGGDSLSYVQFSMELERHYGYLPNHWEKLSVRELEQLPRRQSSRITTLESSILLRALAITGVVVNHSKILGDNYIAGGAMLLLLIAGMNLARFQGNALLEGNWLQPLVSLVQNLLVPYLIIALAFQAYRHDFQLSTLLLYSNFLGPGVDQSIIPTWFIQVLVQIIILFSLLFSFSRVRQLAVQLSPWRFGLAVLAIAIALRLLVPFVWNTEPLYNRVPHMMIWLLVLGWCIHFAQSVREKLVITFILFFLMAFVINLDVSRELWIMLGSSLIIWLPQVPVEQTLKKVIQIFSAAAYYIYLTHMFFIHIVVNVLKLDVPLLKILVALLGGIAVWWLTQMVLQKLFARQPERAYQ